MNGFPIKTVVPYQAFQITLDKLPNFIVQNLQKLSRNKNLKMDLTMSQIIMIAVDSISPGPWDRSAFYQKNIVTAIRSEIVQIGGLPSNKSIKVRMIGENQYECVNGWCRLIACKAEGMESVPCVVHEYTNEQALYEFIRENVQHELTPLMVGKLGLLAQDGNTYNGGRGITSPLGEICRTTGVDRSNLSNYMIRRRVYDHVVATGELTEKEKEEIAIKSKQLYKIRDTCEDCWLPFAKYIANGGDTSRIDKSKNLIERIAGIPNHQYITNEIITFPKMVEMSLGNHTGEGALKMVVEDVVNTINVLNEQGEAEKIVEFKKWLKENAIQYDGNRPFVRFRDVKTKCLSLQNNTDNHSGDLIVNEDARNFIDTIQDDSIHACWLDLPYGVGYHSIHQRGRAIDGDTEREATELHSFVATKLFDKMVENSYVFVWFSPIMVSTISTLFEDVGFKLDSFFIWKKLNHGQLTASSILNINEQALIFTKGRPTWLTRNNNFFECASPENKLHPCEKPFELCEYIVPNIIASGQTLLDLSFGSGNALKAARRHGCRIMGCELDTNHFAVGYNNIYQDDNQQVA
ncbi:MAG: DNA methyltransferase [Solidesulfovibrio sp.]